ncbi:Cytochrome b5-like heme/steroid binding domain [Pseudocohnilembus persalinus]|uniref:Cytochrome b5-like heme/steroid binding domain n=1 Tax=Pseudocohnilembus persalinus TaxID=266149 RepID=A0A0V0R687_PSEPJ|nr:Cytochrome b5-like heme/steroid binding domain [Pseudocohnilembus persalinus]|eukprot:KRX09991.1 Cytochrome b5-like heme/steroid binding domain [Pseudocohnilembus persalinus]
MEQIHSIRLFLEDNEIEFKYSLYTTNDTIESCFNFILNEIKKRHQTRFITLKHVENDEEITLQQLLNKKNKAVYVFLKNKPFLKSDKGLHKRKNRDTMDMTDNNTITIQKYQNYDEAKDKVTYNKQVLGQLNGIFERQNQYFVNDTETENFPELNKQKKQDEAQNNQNNQNLLQPGYVPKRTTYEIAKDDNPLDILKQKKDFQKTGGAGGSYDFVKQSQNHKQVELKGYTPDEIAQHSEAHDCWTVYQGKVYDITNYIRYHPGGQKIMLGAGKDCTALFTKYHSWVNGSFILQKYQVGYVVMRK